MLTIFCFALSISRAFSQDPNAKLIRELREELERLRNAVTVNPSESLELETTRLQLKETQTLLDELRESKETWDEQLKRTQRELQEREKVRVNNIFYSLIVPHTLPNQTKPNQTNPSSLSTPLMLTLNNTLQLLRAHKASVKDGGNALVVESRLPHLISLSGYAAVAIFTIKEGITRVGCEGIDPPQDLIIHGSGSADEHAIIEHTLEHDPILNALVEIVTLHPIADECFVDGVPVSESVRLQPGSVLQFGNVNVYRFNHPTESHRHPQSQQEQEFDPHKTAMMYNPQLAVDAKQREEMRRLHYEKETAELEKVCVSLCRGDE
jgi:hypothetical protein